MIRLPDVEDASGRTLDSTLRERRSIRDYSNQPLALEEVAQLLWAAQGVTAVDGGRTAPSAGALFPLEVCVVVGSVDPLSPGVYRYRPTRHDLVKVLEGDRRAALAAAALGQESIEDGAVVFVIAAVYERTTAKYGETRGVRYVHMEVGHAAQNVLLQAVALGLGAVPMGAFNDRKVKNVVGLHDHERPLYIIPVGPLE